MHVRKNDLLSFHKATTMKPSNSLLLVSTLLATGSAFAPLLPATRQPRVLPRSPSSLYQTIEQQSNNPTPEPILPRVEEKKIELSTSFSSINEPKLVLPSVVRESNKSSSWTTALSVDITQLRKQLRKWSQRPGVRFRLWLGAATSAVLAVTSLVGSRAKVSALKP